LTRIQDFLEIPPTNGRKGAWQLVAFHFKVSISRVREEVEP